mmetsp:Transcript_32814/g.67051  ORF Transcript_32814/g.67051 Transcript_32814/m.67051 type:complete len:208 (+) Transcript_32814:1272-1895(+)
MVFKITSTGCKAGRAAAAAAVLLCLCLLTAAASETASSSSVLAFSSFSASSSSSSDPPLSYNARSFISSGHGGNLVFTNRSATPLVLEGPPVAASPSTLAATTSIRRAAVISCKLPLWRCRVARLSSTPPASTNLRTAGRSRKATTRAQKRSTGSTILGSLRCALSCARPSIRSKKSKSFTTSSSTLALAQEACPMSRNASTAHSTT